MSKNLSEDVIVEIFLRLPVKSLVRFKCVSRRWRSLISDSQFAKSHFKRAPEHTQRLLLSTSSGIRSLDFDEPFGDASAVKKLISYKKMNRSVRILGSCDGLVCLARWNYLYIWNPSTGDSRKVPDPPCTLETYKHGFGYDSSTDDYKLLVATCFDQSTIRQTRVVVFSLKRNSWERIEDRYLDYSRERIEDLYLDYPYYYMMCSSQSTGTLSNGALHWQAHWSDPQDHRMIVAFDLAEEEFREVPTPMVDEYGEDIYFNTLGVLGGRLCFTCSGPTHIELWGMMKYGVQESWARLFRVAYLEEIDYECDLTPLCFSRAGHVVAINNGKELLWSNPEEESLESSEVCSEPDGCEAAVFVETLLSPNDIKWG